MRPESEYVEVLRLVRSGLNDCEVSRTTGVPRCTVRDWRRTGRQECTRQRDALCPICGSASLEPRSYAYLLGLYLGDGCLSEHRRRVYRLRISLDARYPNIIAECARAMALVSGRVVGQNRAPGCIVVGAYWKHWPSGRHGTTGSGDRAKDVKGQVVCRKLQHSPGWRNWQHAMDSKSIGLRPVRVRLPLPAPPSTSHLRL
jgi:hypothetical protein